MLAPLALILMLLLNTVVFLVQGLYETKLGNLEGASHLMNTGIAFLIATVVLLIIFNWEPAKVRSRRKAAMLAQKRLAARGGYLDDARND